MSLTAGQFKVVATIPMVIGPLSILGSTVIIFMVLRSSEKLSTTYHRILFGMCSMDIVSSSGTLLSTIPFPRETPSLWGHLYGNTTTCTIQGVMIFSGNIASNMYNCSLALFYMLTIVYGVRDEVMKKGIEPFFHVVPLVYIVGANIFLLIKKSFNPVYTKCMINSYPTGCHLKPNVPCTRGEHSVEHFWIFHGWPVICMFFFVLLIMGKLYHAVRSQEKKMQSYPVASTLPESIQRLRNRASAESSTSGQGRTPSFSSSLTRSFFRKTFCFPQPRTQGFSRQNAFARRRREAMIQCSLYVLAYFVSYVFAIIHHSTAKRGGANPHFLYALLILTQVTVHLQGLFNFLVFVRPRVIAYSQDEPDLTMAQAFVKAVTSRTDSTIPRSFGRRRRSLQDTQQNGGRRFTAREFHMLELRRALEEDDKDTTQQNDEENKDSKVSPNHMTVS